MTNPMNSPYAAARNEVLRILLGLPPHLRTMLLQEMNLYAFVVKEEIDAAQIKGPATLGVREQG